MRRSLLGVVGLASLALVACGGEAGVELEEETAAMVEDAEERLSVLAEEIEAAEVDETVRSAWDSFEAEANEAFEAVRSGETLDADAVRRELEAFQSSLQSSEAAADLESAWQEVRDTIEELLDRVG